MKRTMGALLAAVLALGTTLVGATPAVAASVGCTVKYGVSTQWDSGFTASVAITNLGAPLTNWTLGFGFAAGQRVTQGWSATWAQSGAQATAASMSWNGALATGGTTTIGFNGSWSGSNPAPSAFTLNGVTCDGTTTGGGGTTPPPTGVAKPIHVSGNKLVDPTGATVRLLGVNRSGGEFMCVQDRGIFDGPVDATATAAIASWHVTAVRVPLNEDCWLGINGVDPAYSGATYRQAVASYVTTLESYGIHPILEMHWSDGVWTGNDTHCPDAGAICQKPMPDAANGPAFWSSVGSAFGSDNAVVFDLFNEPYPNNLTVMDYNQSWLCWRDGGSACTGLTYQAAGMQSLVTAVRGSGATNVILAGGNSYANDLSGWLSHEPVDPAHNLGASWHSYNFNYCADATCWAAQVAPVAAAVPLVATEFGENDCGHSYADTLMSWLDGNQAAGYLAWTWNTWDCSSGPSLISDYNGTPTAYGAGVRAHLSGS